MQFKQARSWRQIGTAPGDGTSATPTTTFYWAVYNAGDGAFIYREIEEPVSESTTADYVILFAYIAPGAGYPPFTYAWSDLSIAQGQGYVFAATPGYSGTAPTGTTVNAVNLAGSVVATEVSTARLYIDSSAVGLTHTVSPTLTITDANGTNYTYIPDIEIVK